MFSCTRETWSRSRPSGLKPLARRAADDDVGLRELGHFLDVARVHVVTEVPSVGLGRGALVLDGEDRLEAGLPEPDGQPAGPREEVDDTRTAGKVVDPAVASGSFHDGHAGASPALYEHVRRSRHSRHRGCGLQTTVAKSRVPSHSPFARPGPASAGRQLPEHGVGVGSAPNLETEVAPQHPGDHPVDQRQAPTGGEHRDRVRRIRADAGQLVEHLRVQRDRLVFLKCPAQENEGLRSLGETEGADYVSDLRKLGMREGVNVGPTTDELHVRLCRVLAPGSLEKDLPDQDLVRI